MTDIKDNSKSENYKPEKNLCFDVGDGTKDFTVPHLEKTSHRKHAGFAPL
ncbi:hypothetical protein [Chryseobacterium sp.]|nr:hypothetical protein [Chryseobacterium sp.]MBO9690442.1 hypothetical protein [Chryseobacterium sp.]